jgi:hypothetical protein
MRLISTKMAARAHGALAIVSAACSVGGHTHTFMPLYPTRFGRL